jgi:hypothetical protein
MHTSSGAPKLVADIHQFDFSNTEHMQALHRYAQKQFFDENTSFIIAMNKLRRALATNPPIQKKIDAIMQRFIVKDAVEALNLPHALIINAKENQLQLLFDVEKNIQKLLWDEPLYKFIDSEFNVPAIPSLMRRMSNIFRTSKPKRTPLKVKQLDIVEKISPNLSQLNKNFIDLDENTAIDMKPYTKAKTSLYKSQSTSCTVLAPKNESSLRRRTTLMCSRTRS